MSGKTKSFITPDSDDVHDNSLILKSKKKIYAKKIRPTDPLKILLCNPNQTIIGILT